MTERAGYFEEFLSFWSAQNEVHKIWFSFFTPQIGATDAEILTGEERAKALQEFANLRARFPKLNMPDAVLKGYEHPPQSPTECIFARTTLSLTADLQNRVTPCQFGGTPDCARCGCMASAGLKAVGDYRLLGFVPVSSVFNLSDRIGKKKARVFSRASA
jgi:hypothetical protein